MAQELLFDHCKAVAMIPDDEMRRLIIDSARQIAETLRCAIPNQSAETSRDFGALEARVCHLEESQETILGKLDKLLEAAAMGRGAWWAILKVGGVLAAMIAAAAWVYDHWPFFGGR